MRITALHPQAKNPDRLNVFVDGQFLLGVHIKVAAELGLHPGQELSPAQLEHLRHEEGVQQAVERALNFLSFRPRSREEVRRYLRRKEATPEQIESALERLDHLDLIDDHAFAEFWIESREQFSPKGAQALKNELRTKGVKREVIDELVTDEQDDSRALQAGRKKALLLLRQPDIDFTTFRTRLGPFLQRRGFGYEVTKRAVSALWAELKQEEGEDWDD